MATSTRSWASRPMASRRFVEQMKEIVRLKNDGGFALNLRYFRHATGEGANYSVKDGIPSGGRLWTDALAELLGPAREDGAPLEDRPPRHRALGAGDLRERLLPSAQHAACALRQRRRRGRRRLRLQLGRQRQDLRSHAVRKVYVQSAGGDAGGAIGAAFATWHKVERDGAKRHFVMDHAYWGPRPTPDEIASAIAARRAISTRRAAASSALATRQHSAAARRRRSPRARSSAGSRDGSNGARARSATARSWAIRAAPT